MTISRQQANDDWKLRWPAQLGLPLEIAQYAIQAGFVRYYGLKRVLDIGCGVGNVLRYLPEDVQYFGVDLSTEAVAAAQRAHPQHQFIAADANTWQPTEKFDCIICNSLNYVGGAHYQMQKLANALTAGGVFVAALYHDFAVPPVDWECLQSFSVKAGPDWWVVGAWRKNGNN